MEKPDLSIVIPVYGNEGSIHELLLELRRITEEIAARAEVVFVVDGSPDNSLATLKTELTHYPIPWQLIEHSRNFGSFPAIRTGLAAARGNFFAVIAADLQEPPELIKDFYIALTTNDVDVAVGIRSERHDSAAKTSTSNAFWGLYRILVSKDMPKGGVDVFGCNRKVRDQLLELRESNSSLIGLLYWIGFRRVEVPYVRRARESGKSGWTLRKKFKYLFDSVFSFTNLPLLLLTAVGVIGGLLTFIAAVVVAVSYASGAISEPGYTPLMLVVALSAFMTLTGLGIVGNYVWRVFENTKDRPLAIVRTIISSSDRLT